MTEYENSKSDDQLEELLMLTEQMQEELDQKDRTIEKLKMQIDESLTLNEKLNSENKAGNIQALKNDLRKTKELLQSEKEKTHTAEIMTEECQDKLRQAEQERDYALSHQKKVEIPVEKPVFFDTIATFTQTIAGWVVLTGKTVAQISNGISNPVVAGIIYWLIKILVYSGCLVGAGILVVFIWMKIAGLYKKYCWDMITVMVILISMAITIYFGDSIKTVLPINLLFLLLFVQLVYVGIRWYVKGWRENRGYV